MMPDKSDSMKILNDLPLQGRVILETCYDSMEGSPKISSKAKAHCTHVKVQGNQVKFDGLLAISSPTAPLAHIVDLLVEKGLMEKIGEGKFRPTKDGFHIGKLASERT